MICEEVRQLLVAVSFGTATAEEREQVEAHLAECDLDHGMAEDSAVATLLAETAPDMAPPDALRGRVIAAATAGGSGNVARPARMEPAGRSGDVARPVWRRLAGPYQVAAVLAVALVAMLAWNIGLQSQPEDEKFVHYYSGGEDNWLRLETELGKSGAQVSLGGLETLAGDTRYHMWVTRGEETVFVGVFNTNPEGQWSGELNFTFLGEDRLWITAQSPADGQGPHGEPALRTRF